MAKWKKNSWGMLDIVLPVAVIIALVATSASRACGQELSTSLPKGVPDPSGWPVRPPGEDISSGTFALSNTRIAYRLSVEPGFLSFYRVSRYQTCDYGAQACNPETLVWYQRTGGSGVHHIYYRFRRRTWKKFWLGHESYWHQLAPGSPEYLIELQRLTRVFFVAVTLRDEMSPATLRF